MYCYRRYLLNFDSINEGVMYAVVLESVLIVAQDLYVSKLPSMFKNKKLQVLQLTK